MRALRILVNNHGQAETQPRRQWLPNRQGHQLARAGRQAPGVGAGQNSQSSCQRRANQLALTPREIEVLKFPWAASGRAITLARTDGLTKLVCEPKTQRLLGMGIVGAGAGELIAEGVLAVEMAAVARDVAETIHPHPTLSETIMESAEIALGGATHLGKPRKA